MSKRQVFWVHVFYWLYVFIISEFINKLAYQNKILNPFEKFGPLAISNYVIFCGLFYFNYLVVLPRLFKRKKYTLTLLSWLMVVFAFIAVRYLVQEVLFLKYLGICNYCLDSKGIYIANNFFQGLSTIIMAGTVIWFVDNWLKADKQKKLLEAEKLQAERAFLQSQVNPHFLFNTLNNIYSMVYHNSSQSLTAIEKLSEIMRYSIGNKTSAGVSLKTEIAYLKNYIELQQMRVKQHFVHYEEKGDFAGNTIVPMLLISFVENAFKHGVFNDPENPLVINLSCANGKLNLFVKNKINRAEPDHASGVGQESVRKLLALAYPGKHSLGIQHDETFYTSVLTLQL